ncbi:MAG: precorrin-2 C(20)-methyltransferase [Lachnospiraceae bacterium]
MAGKLYGIGVGPGDPELLTIKALRLIRASDVIAVPGKTAQGSVAYNIVEQSYPELADKEVVAIYMPMTKDPEELKKNHEAGAFVIESLLKQGKQVAFLTLGDPTVYSTYIYIHARIEAEGYDTEIVSGITSFCAASARLNIGLVEKAQPLHIIPASYQIEDALALKGTKVLMKAGTKMKEVKELLKARNANVLMVENCGMAEEKIYRSVDEIPEEAGYYSLIIVKE